MSTYNKYVACFIVTLVADLMLPSVTAMAQVEHSPQFRVIERRIVQDRVPHEVLGHDQKQRWYWRTWQVEYCLRLEGATGVIVTPADITAKVEGWVANSKVPGHSIPRWSSLTLTGTSLLTATADLVESTDELQRCRERGTLTVWVDEDSNRTSVPVIEMVHDDPDGLPYPKPILSLAPGALVRIRLQLAHQHFVYGTYDALLGRRQFELRIGPGVVCDTLVLCRENEAAETENNWGVPPDDRRDCRYFVSAPDSLHLEAHIPGNQSYRFPERPVRYGTRMRLSYWYLIAPGTEGECRARIAQNKETPSQFKILADGAHEQCLCVIGRWTYVERTFRTEPEATDLVLDFRIAGADVGELWIDNVVLEPVNGALRGP